MNWLVLALALQESVTDEAAKAIRATAKGGYAFTGEAKISSDEMGGEEMTASVSGTVGKPFETVLRSKSGKSTYELFHKGGKTLERLTWKGYPEFMNFGGTADDILSLLDLEPLAKSIKSGKADEEEDGCRVLRLTLGDDALRSYQEENEFDMGLKVDSVALKLWIGKDGLIRKLEAAIGRSFDDGGGDSFSSSTTYVLTLSKHGEAKVEFPAEVLEELK